MISGTPTEAGTLSFTVEVTDGADATADQDLSLTVNLPPGDTGGGTGGTGGANPIAKFTVQRDYDVRGRVISEQDSSVAADQTVTPVYSYSLAPDVGGTQGYEANGNVRGYNDSVMGQWSFSYDQLNRLTGASVSAGHYQGLNVAWGIDAFGNRTGEVYSGNTTAPLSMPVNWVNYDGNNRMTNSSQVMGGYTYDAAGDTTFDGANTYTYDGEGRVSTACAGLACTKYVYDAEGRRVAKGSYDPQSGAFSASEQYILGLGGEEVTALNGDGQWLRTNAYLGGALLATYKDAALYFQFTDWLGTKRVQLANDGMPPEICRSLPYGNQLDCSGATEVDPHHFTGKQRDAETGLDYFGARYYGSNMGRFLSADEFPGGPVDLFDDDDEPPSKALPYADINNPQSLNKYSYTYNNPLRYTDPDGHGVWDFVQGAANAFGSNFFGGAGRNPGGNGDFKDGQVLGDALAVGVGAQAAIEGGAVALGGGALTATGVGAELGVPVAAVGGGVAVLGSTGALTGAKNLAMSLAKLPTGKGSVPPSERDPKRTLTDKQKGEKLAEQKGNCAHCGKPVTGEKGVAHHDPVRHADGGKDMKVVHGACHKDLHSGGC